MLQNKLPEYNTNRMQEPLSVFSLPPRPGWTLLLPGSNHEWTLRLTWKSSSHISGCQHMALTSLTDLGHTHDTGSGGRHLALAVPLVTHTDPAPAPGEAPPQPQGALKSVKQMKQSGKAPLSLLTFTIWDYYPLGNIDIPYWKKHHHFKNCLHRAI